MLFTINRVRLLALFSAAVLFVYPFIDVVSTFACNQTGTGVCGG